MFKTSILIRTKDEESGLEKCLLSIREQTYKVDEIVIVDSGSIDLTLSIAKKYNCKIIQINPDKFTFGYALNIGAENCTGDIIISISAHCLPKNKRWAESLIKHFSNIDVVGVYGRQIPFEDASPIEARGLAEAYPEECRGKVLLFSNANSAFRKSVWRDNKFDEKLTGAEDIDWRDKVEDTGGVFVYEPEAVVYHSHKEGVKSVYIRSKREKEALLKIKSNFAKCHSTLGLIMRCLRSIYLDYVYLLRRAKSFAYLLKWIFLIPLYRVAIYYGQYKSQ